MFIRAVECGSYKLQSWVSNHAQHSKNVDVYTWGKICNHEGFFGNVLRAKWGFNCVSEKKCIEILHKFVNGIHKKCQELEVLCGEPVNTVVILTDIGSIFQVKEKSQGWLQSVVR